MKLKNNILTISPKSTSDLGEYLIVVVIDDGYSYSDKQYTFKLKIVEPPPSPGAIKKPLNMTKASVRITKITRDSKVTLKILSYFLASDLTKMLSPNQMIINITTQNFEIVKFRIESKDIDKN